MLLSPVVLQRWSVPLADRIKAQVPQRKGSTTIVTLSFHLIVIESPNDDVFETLMRTQKAKKDTWVYLWL